MKLLLAGEGRTELGDWAKETSYRPGPGEVRDLGVIEALLDRVCPRARWTVIDGLHWRSIKKYRAGNHRHAEARTVLGLALIAEERGCDALVFLRDRDADVDRQRDVDEGIAKARQLFRPLMIGGVAVEAVEAWILALLGDVGAESRQRPAQRLEQEHGINTTAAMVEVVSRADLSARPSDARSLAAWLTLARVVLGESAR
jgi:hypothetical protein